MEIEVLMSTMSSHPMNIFLKSNIISDTIIVNQFEDFYVEHNKLEKCTCKIYSSNERGVGLSRNTALLRAERDICVMADDDMVYANDYQEIIKKAYLENPSADMIVFRVDEHNSEGVKIGVTKNKRLRFYNSLKYGTVTFTYRRESAIRNRIFFSTEFGGGSRYGSGEDSLFIWDFMKKKLKVYTCNEKIADVYTSESTWFEGYNEKYFYDKGALFYALSKWFSWLLIVQFLFRHRDTYSDKFRMSEVYTIMMSGLRDYRRKKPDKFAEMK